MDTMHEAVGPFWCDYRDRVPSTGWIGDTVHHAEFATREERGRFARLGNHSTHRTGAHCAGCGAVVVDPFGVSNIPLDVGGDPHRCDTRLPRFIGPALTYRQEQHLAFHGRPGPR
jgi:hypothetical protein